MKRANSEVSRISRIKVQSLIPDPHNANKGTERGSAMLEDSLRAHGAGRSILLDKNNKIIAGNKTAEQAAQMGIDDVLIIETSGKQLVAVKRTDLDLENDTSAKMLAVADNRTSELNLSWDADVLTAMEIDLSKFWTEKELSLLTGELSSDDGSGADVNIENKYAVLIECENEAAQTQLLERFEKEGLKCKALLS